MNVFDKIFWKRFADGYKSYPTHPVNACVMGMLQVGVIFFVALIGAFGLIVRLVTLFLAAVGAETAARTWHSLEFPAMIGLAAVSVFYLVKRRYWSRRFQPEVSLRYGEELNRGVYALLTGALISAAAVFMFVTLMFIRTHMAF